MIASVIMSLLVRVFDGVGCLGWVVGLFGVVVDVLAGGFVWCGYFLAWVYCGLFVVCSLILW